MTHVCHLFKMLEIYLQNSLAQNLIVLSAVSLQVNKIFKGKKTLTARVILLVKTQVPLVVQLLL